MFAHIAAQSPAQQAVLIAVHVVEHQPDQQPTREPEPGDERQLQRRGRYEMIAAGAPRTTSGA
jgi:hypothetical protein